MDGRPFNLPVISLTPLVKSHDVKKIVMHAGLPGHGDTLFRAEKPALPDPECMSPIRQ